MTDVLVVGGGPVGVTLANLLVRDGVSVDVVDSAPAVYPKPRAITGDHEALRIFQWCGLGDAVAGMIAPHPGTDYVGVDGGLIKRFDPVPEPWPLGWVPNFVFVQPELEACLREGLLRHPGASLATGTEMTAFAQDADGVRATVRRPDGSVDTLRARYLVACDGAASPVRKRLGIAVEDLDFDEWWIVLDALVEPDIALPPKARQYCRPSRPGTFMVGPRNLRRWEIKILPGEDPRSFDDEARVREVLAEFVDVSKLRIWRSAVYRFHALVAREWRDGRVLLAGDAAHQTPPFMGQGLCAGLRDAANLFWKLRAVIRDGAPETLLDTYAEERRPHVREVIALTKGLGLVIGELDRDRAMARDARMRADLESGRAETVRQRFIPGLASGLLARTPTGAIAPGAGTLFVQPHVVRADGAPERLDDLVGPRFSVVANDPALLQTLGPSAFDVLRRVGARTVAVTTGEARPGAVRETGTLFGDWCREHDCVATVVRPDRYVFGLARTGDELNRLVAQIDHAMR